MAEFKNPNQAGGQDNRSLLLMMVVMVAVFFGLQYFRAKKNPQTVSPNANVPAAVQTAAGVTQPTPSMLAGAGAAPAAAQVAGCDGEAGGAGGGRGDDHGRERAV